MTATGGLAPALVLERTGPTRTVVVLGEGREPMLRLTDFGAEANLGSPTWAATQGAAVEPEERWVPLTAGRQLSYVEPRAAARSGEPVAMDDRHVLRRWTIPVVVDERNGELVGETVWQPERSGEQSSSTPVRALVGAGAGAAVAAGLGVLARRRRVRSSP